MTFTEWLATSPAVRAYRTATNRCIAAFAPTITAAAAELPVVPDTSVWIHHGTGQVRHYINNVADIIGFDYATYKTGNVSSACLDGHDGRLSNVDANRILWCIDRTYIVIDENTTSGYRLFLTSDAQWSARAITRTEVADRIHAAIAAHGTNRGL